MQPKFESHQMPESVDSLEQKKKNIVSVFEHFGFVQNSDKEYEVVLPMKSDYGNGSLKQTFSYDELIEMINHYTDKNTIDNDYVQKIEQEFQDAEQFLEKQLLKLPKETLYEYYSPAEIKKALLDLQLPKEVTESLARLIAKEQTPGTKLLNEGGEKKEVVQKGLEASPKEENTITPLEESREQLVEKLFYTPGIVYMYTGTYNGVGTPFVYSEGKNPLDFDPNKNRYNFDLRSNEINGTPFKAKPIELEYPTKQKVLGILFPKLDYYKRGGFGALTALFEKENPDIEKKFREDPQLFIDIFNKYFSNKLFPENPANPNNGTFPMVPQGERVTLGLNVYSKLNMVSWSGERYIQK